MIRRYFQLERKNIVLVQFIIEGYGEMATVKTLDPQTAVIQISIIPDFMSDMNGLLEGLKEKYKMKEMADYQNKL